MKLTVIIRDDSPMLHAGDVPTFRTVVLTLTPEQDAALALRVVAKSSVGEIREQISDYVLEQSK